MTEQKLDLLQFASGIVTESSARPPEIVWRELGNSWPLRVFLDHVPDYFFRDLRSPNSPFATNAAKDFSLGNLRYRHPVINGLFYPIWHWDRPDVPALSYQVDNCPMIFAALDMVKREINEFSPTEPTPQESR